MLFFLAGSEIDIDRIRGRVLNRSILGWLVALVAGLAVGIGLGALLGYGVIAGVFIGIALTSTALGTIMPVLRDAGELRTPFGTAVIGIGAAGEFGPLIAISLFLSGRNPGVAAAVLLAFTVLAATAIVISARGHHHNLHAMITTTLRTSGQFAVRFVILIVAAMVALSLVLGLDMLLGAFAAAMIDRFILADATPADLEAVETKLEAVGFGFLVPVFFVVHRAPVRPAGPHQQSDGASAPRWVRPAPAARARADRAVHRCTRRLRPGPPRHRAARRHRTSDHRGRQRHRHEIRRSARRRGECARRSRNALGPAVPAGRPGPATHQRIPRRGDRPRRGRP
jgi:hypothetical protein